MKKEVLLIIILSLFFCVLGFAGETPKVLHTKTIVLSGKISDSKSNEYLAGVKIACTNCQKVVYSDLDGRFFIYMDANTNTSLSENLTVEFSQIGYSSKTFKLHDLQANSGNLYIELQTE